VTLFSDLYPNRDLISRQFFTNPGTTNIVAPAGAAFIRVSAVGAGGFTAFGAGTGFRFGGGAAFARTLTACAAGDHYDVQVGDIAHTSGAGDALGDSKVTKVVGGAVIVNADRGRGTGAPNKGLAANCVGDVKRDGSDGGAFGPGGSSAGDDADLIQLGFGGPGIGRSAAEGGAREPASYPGAGGASSVFVELGESYSGLVPGNGMVCVEFFKTNPGY
jgi:hypothetical protein